MHGTNAGVGRRYSPSGSHRRERCSHRHEHESAQVRDVLGLRFFGALAVSPPGTAVSVCFDTRVGLVYARPCL